MCRIIVPSRSTTTYRTLVSGEDSLFTRRRAATYGRSTVRPVREMRLFSKGIREFLLHNLKLAFFDRPSLL